MTAPVVVSAAKMATIEERLKNAPPRLVILAACAFARSVEHLLTDQRSRDAIETAERFADGEATEEEVRAAEDAARAVQSETRFDAEGYAATTACTAIRSARTNNSAWAIQTAVWARLAAEPEVAPKTISEAAEITRAAVEASGGPAINEAEAAQHSILDCLLPPRIQSTFPPFIKGLATTIYAKRDWGLMLILADALEDLELYEMAAHCRTKTHAKGCFVLDSIMGKN